MEQAQKAPPIPLPPRPILVYLSLLVIALAGMVHTLWRLYPEPLAHPWWDIAFWALLVAWSQRIGVHLSGAIAFSHLFLIALALTILLPPWLAPLLVFIFHLNPDLSKPTYPWFKDLFNRAQTALSTGAAALAWHLLTQGAFFRVGNLDLSEGLGIAGAAFIFFLVNITLVSLVIHLASGEKLAKIWQENIRWSLPSALILAPVALLLARAYETPLIGGWGGWTVLLFLAPIYLSRFYWEETVRMREALETQVQLLMQALDAKDPHTRQHSERVAAIARDLTRAYLRRYKDSEEAKRLDPQEVYLGARVHDIGKIGLPDAILFKPGPLTPEERQLVESHPARGEKLLAPARRAFAPAVYRIVRHHHERWDGRGYPNRLAGQEVSLEARIVALADAYEAMTAGRPHRKAKTPEEALKEIVDLAGVQFDPRLVELFQELWSQDPIWKDREVYLSHSTSPLSSAVWPLPSPSESGSGTSQG